MKKWKKKILILLSCMGLLLLAGFGSQAVRLLSEKPPLLDLDKAIQDAQFGHNGNEASQEGKDPENPADGKNKEKTITIRVRGEEIWYNERKCNNLTVLEAWLRGDGKSQDTVVLADDYAESHCYDDTAAVIEMMRDKVGFSYREEEW